MGKAKEIAPGVYQVSALGMAVTVLSEDGRVVLLDAGLRVLADQLREFLATQGFSFSHVSHILVSHYHPDHIGGLARLKVATGAQVGAHAAEAPYINGAWPYPNPASTTVLKALLAPLTPFLRPRPVEVDWLLHDGARLDFLGGLEVIHTPGHTPGSVSFFLPARGMVFVGDALQRWWGRLGLPSSYFTQDMEVAKVSIQRLAQLDVETVCFSHFPPILKGARKELQELVDRAC